MCPEKYFISIIRFNLNTKLPVFVPQLNYTYRTSTPYTPFDPNLTNYLIAIQPDLTVNTVYARWVEFTPQTLAPPPTVYNFSANYMQYYYIYSYTYFLTQINLVLKNLWNDAGLNTGPPAGNYPQVYLDTSTFNLSIQYPAGHYQLYNQDIAIFFNNQIMNLFASLPTQQVNLTGYTYIVNPTGQPAPQNDLWNKLDFTTSQAVGPNAQLSITTETTPLSNWNPVSSIVFTTTTMPVVPTNISPPKIYGSSASLQDISASNGISTEVTDFIINIGPNSTYNSCVEYIPSGPYRLLDMYGNSPLNNIDLVVWWKDKYSNLYPLLIPSGGSCNIKLMFRKKNFNTSSKNIIV